MISFLSVLMGCVGVCLSGGCGKTPVPPSDNRIVGGEVAVPYSWPWQVEFCAKSNYWKGCTLDCGGTIISNQWIMTAAHCVYHHTTRPDTFGVNAGVFKKDSTGERGEEVMEIADIHIHPNYSAKTISHDVALLKLKNPLNFTDHIQPICLSHSDEQLTVGTLVTVTGWGTTTAWQSPSSELRQVRVPVVSESICTASYAKKGFPVIQEYMFCAGVGGKDSCQGDSGGPLSIKHSDGLWYQHGIVSWGYMCAEKGYPGVYSRVSAYCQFISTTTNGQVHCS